MPRERLATVCSGSGAESRLSPVGRGTDKGI